MTKCLVLGGNGFIGSHLVERLVQKGYSVRVFDNFKLGMTNLKKVAGDIEKMNGDFLNNADITRALTGIDYLFHYISTTVPTTAVKDPIYDIESSLVGSVKLLQLAVKNNVKKVIFPSSGGTVYGEPSSLPVKEINPLDPLDPYGISKLAVEKYLKHFYLSYQLDYLILRYSNPFGERQYPHSQQGIIPIFLNKIKMGERPVIYGDGSMERDYIYISDAIDATVAILESSTKSKVFNIGRGEGTTVNKLVEVMSQSIGENIEPLYEKDSVVRVQKIVLDISRIREETGWKPSTSLEEGIKKTWQWIKSCPQNC
jgi:UDP-glucose 4-epimerase